MTVYEGNFIRSVLYLITCCVNSTTKLVGVKGFVSGTCSPPFEGHVEISFFNVHGINFSKLIFDFTVVTEALR